MGCNLSSSKKSEAIVLKTSDKVNLEDIEKVHHNFNATPENQTRIEYHSNNLIEGEISSEDAQKFKSLLQNYSDLDEEINRIESNDPIIDFYIKQNQLRRINESILQLEKIIKSTKQTISKDDEEDQKNIPAQNFNFLTLKKIMSQFGDKEKFNNEEQNIITSANKLEIAITELELYNQEKAWLENDLSKQEKIVKDLGESYEKLSNILENLGIEESYSEEESKLKVELVELQSTKTKILEIYKRWSEAEVELIEIASHFSKISQKLSSHDELINAEFSYEEGEEIRDTLVSIWLGLKNVKFYMGEIKIPYCTLNELETFNKAMTYLFIDLKSKDRIEHALNFYTAFHKRVLALLIWTNQTNIKVVFPALVTKNEEINRKLREASQLRLKHLSEKENVALNGSSKISQESSEILIEEKNSGRNLIDILDPLSMQIYQDFNFESLANFPKINKLISIKNILVANRGENYEDENFSEMTLNINKVKVSREERKESINSLSKLFIK